MWQVSNNLNTPILKRYGDLISSLFELLINISSRADKENLLLNDNFLSAEFRNAEYLDEKLLSINKTAQCRLKPLIEEIVRLDTNDLETQYRIYNQQNTQVFAGNYNISQEQHPDCLKILFKDYFYTAFFGIEWIWVDLVGKEYKRDMFKTDFKTENELYVCPYCDTDTISSSRNGWIEHFLPKSKYPYLACNPLNLIPSCTACNVSGSGKGEDVINPIINQYSAQIGDSLEFELENGKISIKENDDLAIENFIKLLKLRSRYNEENVESRILSTLKVNYSNATKAISKEEFDKDEFFQFIHDSGRNNGLYFIQKNLLQYIDEI